MLWEQKTLIAQAMLTYVSSLVDDVNTHQMKDEDIMTFYVQEELKSQFLGEISAINA